MPFHLTRDGVMTEIPADSRDQASVVTSLAEWERIAGVWPLKRLVAIWNALPGVTPVEKFTNRQIALERRIMVRAHRSVRVPRKPLVTFAGKRRCLDGHQFSYEGVRRPFIGPS